MRKLRLQVVEIDRFGDEIESAESTGMASSLVVAVGGHHQDRQIRATLLDFAEQLQAVHARHVYVRENRHESGLNLFREPIQGLPARGGEMHHVRSLACFSTKALAKQIGDIRFVVHDQNTYTHNAAAAVIAR